MVSSVPDGFHVRADCGRDCGACAAISMNTPSRSFRVKCTKIKKFKTSFEIRNDLLTQHHGIDIAKSIHPAT